MGTKEPATSRKDLPILRFKSAVSHEKPRFKRSNVANKCWSNLMSGLSESEINPPNPSKSQNVHIQYLYIITYTHIYIYIYHMYIYICTYIHTLYIYYHNFPHEHRMFLAFNRLQSAPDRRPWPKVPWSRSRQSGTARV